MSDVKPVCEMTDEELFDDLRYQVNLSRNKIGHNRHLTRELSLEMHKRGFMQKSPTPPQPEKEDVK